MKINTLKQAMVMILSVHFAFTNTLLATDINRCIGSLLMGSRVLPIVTTGCLLRLVWR